LTLTGFSPLPENKKPSIAGRLRGEEKRKGLLFSAARRLRAS
jgi:hypothetical protein